MDEVEAKYRLAGPEEHERLRARLIALGARPGPAEDERNLLFDRGDGSLFRGDSVLRVRILNGGPAGRLTYKGAATYQGAVKQRMELEVGVDDTATTRALLEALGYALSLEYSKHREPWHLEGAEVALDSLVFGTFCEIEGPRETIGRLADTLGLSADAAEPAGYPMLMARFTAAGARPAP